MADHRTRAVLIVTLGGKPQVVTFALDLLQLRGDANLEAVYALHYSRTANPRIDRAIKILEKDFRAHYPDITFKSAEIGWQRGGVTDLVSDSDDQRAAHAAWLTAHTLFTDLRNKGYGMELCVTGGPRLIALQTLSVATLLFAPHDHCWHVFTPPAVRAQAGEGELLHAPDYAQAGLQLIAVPLLPVSLLMPGLRMAAEQSPEQIMAGHSQWIEAEETRRCREVAGRLTPRQREVLRAFARAGADAARVGAALRVSENTLSSHRKAILAECRAAWGLGVDERLTHHFLREKFGRLPPDFWRQWVRKNHRKG